MEKKTIIKKATGGKFSNAKGRANLITFCKILDDLPVNFTFTLTNAPGCLDGSWEKAILDGTTAWQNGATILFNSSFFPRRYQVLEAIEREGWQVKKLYFADKKPKKSPTLTREKIRELYYEQKKSLRDIAREYGYTRQWIQLLMQKYGQERRTPSEAQKLAVNQGKR